MSTAKPTKKPRATKSKADLEAKIAELEAKLNALATQSTKPAETKPTPPPAPKQVEQRPPPPPAPKPQVEQRPPPPPPQGKPTLPAPTESAQTSKPTQEVAPAYSTLSSTGYTGNRYYATRQRLAYHPADKQFTGQVTVQVSRPAPSPAPEPEPRRAEPEPQKRKEEPRRIEPPTPTVKYTGANYYKTRQRLAYHPPDKQFIETVAIKFEDAPTAAKVEAASSQSSSTQKRSRAEELAAYEKAYLERVQQQRAEAEKPAPAPAKTKPHGTM